MAIPAGVERRQRRRRNRPVARRRAFGSFFGAYAGSPLAYSTTVPRLTNARKVLQVVTILSIDGRPH